MRVRGADHPTLDEGDWGTAEQRDDVEDGREKGGQREVIAAHRDYQVVVRLDVLPNECVLWEQAAEGAVVERGRLHGGVDREEIVPSPPQRFLVEPVRHVALLDGGREDALVAIERGARVVKPVPTASGRRACLP